MGKKILYGIRNTFPTKDGISVSYAHQQTLFVAYTNSIEKPQRKLWWAIQVT
jgi:hypothetical protein